MAVRRPWVLGEPPVWHWLPTCFPLLALRGWTHGFAGWQGKENFNRNVPRNSRSPGQGRPRQNRACPAGFLGRSQALPSMEAVH